jgi:anti-sigma factor ChrR (cupin superfamily)
MDPESKTLPAEVLDGSAKPSSLLADTSHPTERVLARFASNEMGPQRKKLIARHLETCPDCRKAVTRFHDIGRRYRDLERRAIQHVASGIDR